MLCSDIELLLTRLLFPASALMSSPFVFDTDDIDLRLKSTHLQENWDTTMASEDGKTAVNDEATDSPKPSNSPGHQISTEPQRLSPSVEEEDTNDEEEEEPDTSLQPRNKPSPSSSLSPPPPSSSPASQTPTKPVRKLTLNLKFSAPKTPLNMTNPLFMPRARNHVWQAAWEKHIKMRVTPLRGKRGVMDGKWKRGEVKGRNVWDLLQSSEMELDGDEDEIERWIGRRSGEEEEEESDAEKWFRKKLWGAGRWASRV